jgi:hypothetical protein
MRETRVSFPELAVVAATRGMLGVGAGLLLAPRLGSERRRAVGMTLFVVGVLSTIPLALEIFGRGRKVESAGRHHRPAAGTSDHATTSSKPENLWYDR